jgi:hypothetical protein
MVTTFSWSRSPSFIFWWWHCWLQTFSFWPCPSTLTVVIIHLGVMLLSHCVIYMVRQSSLDKEFARAISTNATGGIHLRRSNCASTLHNRTFIHYHPAIIHFTLTISNNNKQASKAVSSSPGFLLSLVQCTAYYCLIGYHPVRIDKKTVNCDRQVTRGD